MTQGFTRDIDITSLPNVSSGAGAPASTPSKVGDIYVDTTAKRRYTACGTSSSADWLKDAVFKSGIATVTGGGGDVAVTLPWDWTDGTLEIHNSRTNANYFEIGNATYMIFKASYISLTSGTYTSEQVCQMIEGGNGVYSIVKTDNRGGLPKSATSTTFVLDDDGTTTYVKWFVWA